MANNISNIFETLVVPAATASAQAAKFTNSMLDKIFVDYSGKTGEVGNTMQINIPVVDEGEVQNITSGPINVTATNQTATSVVITNNESLAKRIQSFDQVRTPLDLQRLYLDAMIESVLRKCNRFFANMANPASSTGFLTTNAAVTGATANEYIRADISSAWQTLVGQGCPMNPANSFFVSHHVPYGNMLADTTNNWIQQYVVGTEAAIAAQQSARLMQQFLMTLDYDQQMPQNGSSKYCALAFHRYAIGAVPVVQPPVPTGDYVREMTIYPRKDWPLRVQLWYDPNNQGYTIHVNSVFGGTVVRPEWGVQVTAG